MSHKDKNGETVFTPPKYPPVAEKDGKLFQVKTYWLNSPRLSKNFLKRQMNCNDNKDEYTGRFSNIASWAIFKSESHRNSYQ